MDATLLEFSTCERTDAPSSRVPAPVSAIESDGLRAPVTFTALQRSSASEEAVRG